MSISTLPNAMRKSQFCSTRSITLFDHSRISSSNHPFRDVLSHILTNLVTLFVPSITSSILSLELERSY